MRQSTNLTNLYSPNKFRETSQSSLKSNLEIRIEKEQSLINVSVWAKRLMILLILILAFGIIRSLTLTAKGTPVVEETQPVEPIDSKPKSVSYWKRFK